MPWSDVAEKAFDLLQRPTGLGVLLISLLFLFLIYVIPIGVVTWVGYYNTDRLEKAIAGMATNCVRSVANQKPTTPTE